MPDLYFRDETKGICLRPIRQRKIKNTEASYDQIDDPSRDGDRPKDLDTNEGNDNNEGINDGLGVEQQKPVPFATIPQETVINIAAYLPPVSKLALSQACSGLFHKRESLHVTLPLSDNERYEFVCMLERDGRLSDNKLACAGCRKTHGKSSFPDRDVDASPSERYCWTTKRMMRVCPHHIYSFKDLKGFCSTESGVSKTRKYVSCPQSVNILQSGGHNFIGSNKGWKLKDTCDILNVGPLGVPSRARVSAALKALDLQICPHMCSGDREISEAYNPVYNFIRGYEYKSGAYVACNQLSCDTRVEFMYPRTPFGTKLHLIIQRRFGRLNKQHDKVWRSQLIHPDESRMKARWTAGMRNWTASIHYLASPGPMVYSGSSTILYQSSRPSLPQPLGYVQCTAMSENIANTSG